MTRGGNLAHDEQIDQPPARPALRRRAFTGAEGAGQIHLPAEPSLCQAERQPRRQRNENGKAEHAAIYGDFVRTRQVSGNERTDRADTHNGEQATPDAADPRDQQTLDQEPASNGHAPGAQCRPDRNLAPSFAGSGNHDVGHVHAGNGQQGPDSGEEEIQTMGDIAGDFIDGRNDPHAEVPVRIRILRAQV